MKTMVSFWGETHGQNVSQAQLRRLPKTPREKVMAVVPKDTSCWEGKATEFWGPAQPSTGMFAVMTTLRGALISLAWVMVGLEAAPRLSQEIAPCGCAASSDTSHQLGWHIGVGGRRERDFWLGT